jgi:putative transposase
MKYDPEKHKRRSIRLKGYDYAQAGSYFITICTHQRQCLFGQVVEGQMQLNAIGLAVQARWQTLPQNFPNLILDTWVIMPNHIHGILCLDPNPRRGDAFGTESMRSPQISPPNASPSGSGTSITPPPQISPPNASPVEASSIPPRGTQSHSIAAIVQNFKSISTRKINQLQNTPGQIIWQRNYHEHIIRDDNTQQLIRTYIRNNPAHWDLDQLHPDHPVHR